MLHARKDIATLPHQSQPPWVTQVREELQHEPIESSSSSETPIRSPSNDVQSNEPPR